MGLFAIRQEFDTCLPILEPSLLVGIRKCSIIFLITNNYTNYWTYVTAKAQHACNTFLNLAGVNQLPAHSVAKFQ